MLKYIVKNLNKNLNKNLFNRSLCNLALDNKYLHNIIDDMNDININNDINEDLFIEKINYNVKKKYLTITKQPYYLDEDYIKENYKYKKTHMICESLGSKCYICDGKGMVFNGINYDICSLCNGNGIY